MSGTRRGRSLFARLLLAQALLVAAMALLFGGLYYIERNRAVGELLAQHWGRALAAAAGTPTSIDSRETVQRRGAMPAGAIRLSTKAPRVSVFVEALAREGVPVEELAVAETAHGSTVWLRIATPAASAPQWLGIPGGLVEPRAMLRLLTWLIAAAVLAVGLSWALARWLASPLERLRERIRSGEPPARDASRAPPEIADIEQAYGALLARLSAQQRERRLMLAGISHDLRSPLGRIQVAAELLPGDDPIVDARRRAIVANVHTADQLIESFLDLVRAEELPLAEEVDVAQLAQDVVAAFDCAQDTLSVDASESAVLPCANRDLLERALSNLIDNALKHGRPPVAVRVSCDSEAVSIAVRDTGAGIAVADRERLLQPFARGDCSRGHPGAGMGLAVVRQVVRRLRGKVAFDSGAAGSCVRLWLPLTINSTSPSSPSFEDHGDVVARPA